MLIDKIISAKTDQSVSDFTGGNIQYSVSKYTKQMKIKLVLYFGFDFNRNTISRQIEIQKKDVHVLVDELSIKTESYLLSLVDDDILDLDSFVKDSYECNTTIVLGASSDRDNEDRVDKGDSDTKSHQKIFDLEFNTWFDLVWDEYRKFIKTYRPQYGQKKKAIRVVNDAANRLLKLTEWDNNEDLFDWLGEYINSKLNKEFTPNLEKWPFDDFEDFAEEDKD